MHLRIYLWLSCIVLAGYTQAIEKTGASGLRDNGVAAPEASSASAADARQSGEELFIDDDPGAAEGSGGALDTESSGSGWGPDDEDAAAAGSGAFRPLLPDDDDDEDHAIARVLPPVHAAPLPKAPVPAPAPAPGRGEDDVRSRISLDDDLDVPRVALMPVNRRKKPTNVDSGPGDSDNSAGASANLPGVPVGGNSDIIESPDNHDIDISSAEHDDTETEEKPSSPPDRETGVFIMNTKSEDRATSFFAQPGILAAVIGGAVVGLLCAILVVMFIVYRMRKKDEGSYALDEPKRSPAANSYGKGQHNREFYA